MMKDEEQQKDQNFDKKWHNGNKHFNKGVKNACLRHQGHYVEHKNFLCGQ
jgi:hypothetical protein